jgi:hypothetical protein
VFPLITFVYNRDLFLIGKACFVPYELLPSKYKTARAATVKERLAVRDGNRTC